MIKLPYLLPLMLVLAPLPAFAQASPDDLMTQARGLYDRGQWSEAIATYKKAHKTAPASSPRKAEAALEWSSILREQGKFRQAHKRAEEALKLARKIRQDRLIGRLLLTLGHIETGQGRLSTARSTFQICVSSTRGKDPVFHSLCSINLSLIEQLRGKPGMAKASMRSHIQKIKAAGTTLTTGSALAKTADLYQEGKDYGRALSLLQQAQGQFAAAGSVPAQARNRLRMAQVLQLQGNHDGARAQLGQAIPTLRKMNNRPALINAYGLQGKDAQQRGDQSAALGHYQRALKLAQNIGSPQLIAKGHLAMCEALAGPPVHKLAESHCVQAASRFGKLRVPKLEARARITLANIQQRRNDFTSARAEYKRALKILETKVSKSRRDPDAIATQRANLCQVNHSLKVTGALLSCINALKALRALPNSAAHAGSIAASHYAAGFGAQREKRLKAALRHFEQAAKIYARQSQRERSADAFLRLGMIYAVVLKGEPQAQKSFDDGITQASATTTSAGKALHAQLLTQLSQLHLERAAYPKTIATIDRLLTLPNLPPATRANAYNMLASARLKTKDRDGAVAALRLGVQAIASDASQKDLRDMMKRNLERLTKK